MRIAGILFTFALTLSSTSSAALIGPGDIAFIGFNADGNKDFAFVTLADIDASTSVFFSDNDWTGSAFTPTEGTINWFSGTSLITAGTVVSFNNLLDPRRTVSHGQFAEFSGTFSLSGSDEELWAYLGPNRSTPSAFLGMIANETEGVTGGPVLSGTGLVDGVSAQIIDGDEDIMAYVGPRSGQASFSSYLSLISNDANWITQDGPNDQSNDTIAPDVPFDATSFTLSSASAAPEPSSIILATSGVLVIAATKRRRRSKVLRVSAHASSLASQYGYALDQLLTDRVRN